MKPDREQRRKVRGQALVAAWEPCLKAGLEARAEYDRAAKEVLSLLDPKHASVFAELEERAFSTENSGIPVSINKAASVLNTLLPQVLQQNPTRAATAHTKDGFWWSVAEMVQAYLNYTAREGNLEDQIKAALLDGVARGRGFLRAGYDPDRGIITSWYVSSQRVVIDPAATCWESAEWIAVRRRAPVWRLERELYPDKDERRANAWRFEGLSERENTATSKDPQEGSDKTYTDQVVVWEIYSKRGAGLVRGPTAPDGYEDEDDPDSVKLIVAEGHNLPLWEGEWEAPVYLDAEWPLVKWDPIPTLGVDRLWPQSPFSQGASSAKMIDVTSTAEAAQVVASARSITVVHTDRLKDEDAVDRIKCGDFNEVLEASGDDPAPQGGFLDTKPLGAIDPNLAGVRRFHAEQFDETLGLAPSITGANPSGAQDRSAAASQLRAQGASARTGELRNGAELFCSRSARLEQIMLLLGDVADEEDVARACGDAELGYLVSIRKGTLELPLRRAARQGDLTMQEVFAPAATTFRTEAQAQAAVQGALEGIWRLFLSPEARRRAAPFVTYLPGQQGLPEPAFDVEVRPVTVDDLFRELAGLSPREILRECYVEVVAGTAQRHDPTAKRERGSFYLQYALPVAADLAKATGNYEAVNKVFAAVDRAYEVPESERMEPIANVPPPMPAPAPGAPPPAGSTA